jgi:hypothetical protein
MPDRPNLELGSWEGFFLHSLGFALAARKYLDRGMEKGFVQVAVRFFPVYGVSGGGAFLQAGPFARQAACENYRTRVVSNPGSGPNLATLSCFSTTAKTQDPPVCDADDSKC